MKSYQTFGTRIDYADQQETDGKPRLRILPVEWSKRNNAQFFDENHTCNTDDGLNAQQKECHRKPRSRNDELREGTLSFVYTCNIGPRTLFTTVMRIEARQ